MSYTIKLLLLFVLVAALTHHSATIINAQTITRSSSVVPSTTTALYHGFQVGSFGYWALYQKPAGVVKINLDTMSVVSTANTDSTISYATGAFHWIPSASPSSNFGVFCTVSTAELPKVFKVDLLTMTISTSVFSGTSGNSMYTGVIVASNDTIVVGLFTVPGKLVEIDLTTMTSTGRTISGNFGENYFESSALIPSTTYAIFGCSTSPGIIVKFDLQTFTRVGAVSGIDSTEAQFVSISMINSNDAFCVCYGGTSAKIVRFDTSSTMSRTGVATVGGDTTGKSQLYGSVAYNADNSVFVVSNEANPGRIFKLDTTSMSFVASADGSSSATDERAFRSVLLDSSSTTSDVKLYVSTGTGQVVKFSTSAGSGGTTSSATAAPTTVTSTLPPIGGGGGSTSPTSSLPGSPPGSPPGNSSAGRNSMSVFVVLCSSLVLSLFVLFL